MQLTETIKLYLTNEQKTLIRQAMDEYIQAVNDIVAVGISGTSIKKFSSKDVKADLPSAIRAQVARDARSILAKYYKTCHKAVLTNRRLKEKDKDVSILAPNLPIMKRPCCYINNQNFKITENGLSFPMMVDGKSKRITVQTSMTSRQKELLQSKLGTLRLVLKDYAIVAQITYEVLIPELLPGDKIMGVDIGIKCPAVSYTSDGEVKFYGNGRKNKYLRRHYKYMRKKLQSKKKPKAVKRIGDKEQRIMRDTDHKISASIVKEAVAKGAFVIKVEKLANIRKTTRTSRKNNYSLHTWSFYRLLGFIEYKAKLAGIEVIYVDPRYTSQTCPVCSKRNHARDRQYVCKCGYRKHRDIVGAINICNSTEIVCNRQSA
ncbi:putative transposase [Lachnospiraceae bacterium PF1-22]